MDSTARHILSLHRRGALRGALGLAALAALQPARAQLGMPIFRNYPFTLGVASGDPLPDGVVLWTRLATDPLASMGGLPHVAFPVAWEVSEDDRFTRIIARGEELARPELGFSIHAEVTGLAAAHGYFYRFRSGREVSQTGRTRTAPAADARPERLRFVSAGCQHLEQGHFTAWRHVAEEADLDFVFHSGDYIYEYRGVLPGQPSWGPILRTHQGDEIHTLDHYRQRYAQYHADPDLMAAHAAHPFIMSFDDHEVDNDWAGPHSEEAGLPPFPIAVPPEIFALRKQAAFQAWWENMPLRRAQLPRGPEITAYRRLDYGRLARLHVLDTRSWRDDQPCGGTPAVQRPCDALGRPDQQMLGTAQEAWLMDGMAGATWNILAQQVLVMPRDLPGGMVNVDKWDGTPAARERLLRGIADRRLGGAVVLTGDSHNAWVADLKLGDAIVATEFAATSITSLGDGSETLASTPELLSRNPHIHFHSARRGYSLHDATPARMAVTQRVVPYVTRPGAPREDRGVFVTEAGRPGIQRG